mmetsp:Transcript_12579/g.27171  ORF Transcript_12579/g.27171 Transcript_12579/m.27171 type:complete len:341 (-) Transcript_12579:469-1491(-)
MRVWDSLPEDAILTIAENELALLPRLGCCSASLRMRVRSILSTQRAICFFSEALQGLQLNALVTHMPMLELMQIDGRCIMLRDIRHARILDFSDGCEKCSLSPLAALALAPLLRENRELSYVRVERHWLYVRTLRGAALRPTPWSAVATSKENRPMSDSECCLAAGLIEPAASRGWRAALCTISDVLTLAHFFRPRGLHVNLRGLSHVSVGALGAAEIRCHFELTDLSPPVLARGAQLELLRIRRQSAHGRGSRRGRSDRLGCCSRVPVAVQLVLSWMVLLAMRIQEDAFARQTGYNTGALFSQHQLRSFSLPERLRLEESKRRASFKVRGRSELSAGTA